MINYYYRDKKGKKHKVNKFVNCKKTNINLEPEEQVQIFMHKKLIFE